VYRRGLVSAAGNLRLEFDGAQDHDLALRIAMDLDPRRVCHLPQVLYHWRQSPGSMSAAGVDACREAALAAVRGHLGRRARAESDPDLPQWPRLRFTLPTPAPAVSVIGGKPPSTYEPSLLEYVADPAWARGDVLVFLAETLRPVTPDWLEELVVQASRPEIGAAGARLLGRDGSLVHAGYTLHPDLVAHSPRGAADDPGYRGQFRLLRSVAAVSGDCLAVRRAVFEAAGGFTASAGAWRAVDLCLKLNARGLRCVWTPYAELQYAGKTAEPRSGAAWMRKRWAGALAADPYANPNLRLTGGRLALARARLA
jgi:hypothetical protein